MKESFKTALSLNNVSVELNPFVEKFLARTVVGAVSSLKGVEDIQSLELYLEQGDVRIIANGNELPITPFPNDIIANTLIGLVSSLKGVDHIESVEINIEAL